MRILTFALCLLCLSVSAQNNSINVYPWNPDSDNDNQIGVDDLQSFLTVYGNEFGLPPEPCTYDGTPLEDLAIGVAEGTIVLDSVFVEYEIEDSSTYYVLGCPDPITEIVVYQNATMLSDFYSLSSNTYWAIRNNNGPNHEFIFYWETSTGEYRFRLTAPINSFTEDGFFGGVQYGIAYTNWQQIPFSDDWFLDEEGIHIESGWDEGDWVYYANYLHILPYWHYADE